MSWARAVKEWNSGQIFRDDMYGIPKKGGDYYDDVKEIMERSTFKKTVTKMMGKKEEEPKPEPKFSTDSKSLTDFLFLKDSVSTMAQIDRETEFLKRNPPSLQRVKELKETIRDFVKEGKEAGVSPKELIDYLKEFNPEAMKLTSQEKDQPKSEPKKEGIPFFVPKLKPDYENIPSLPSKDTPNFDKIKKEIDRIKKLKEIPEGRERTRREINSFGSLIGKATLGNPEGKWIYNEFKSREEATKEHSDAVAKFKNAKP